MEQREGRFITLEGSEGVGKTTQMAYVQARIEAAGYSVYRTREPGGADISEKIRGVLLDPENKTMSADTELLLIFAARAQHLNEVIRPRLQAGVWVLCDRFTDATYAYQGGGRGIDIDRIAKLEQWVQGAFRPDLTLLLDAPVEVGLKRAYSRSQADRFEQERSDFFERVRQVYLDRAQAHPKQFQIIDASLDVNAVQATIAAVLDEYLTP